MNNKLVEEIDDVLHDLDHGNITRGEAKSKLLLAIAAKVEEPLAVFVDQHGWFLKDVMHFQVALTWSICLCRKQSSVNYESFKQIEARTYAECEAKARQYLEGLPDVKGGK